MTPEEEAALTPLQLEERKALCKDLEGIGLVVSGLRRYRIAVEELLRLGHFDGATMHAFRLEVKDIECGWWVTGEE